jgi:uncharacterized repeat protein (TIGR03803 family)
MTTLYSFSGTDGQSPGHLLQATNGNFYGLADIGGAMGDGTVFEITPAGVLTTLYSFCSQKNCGDGSFPNGLMQATNGNFYGTTANGGLSGNWGTIFQITPKGALTTLHRFCSQTNCADGALPQAGLMLDTDGTFYGVTSGGTYGTIFSLSSGISPFVEALPNFGRAGRVVGILGTDLTGTTGVSFNGTPATTFTVLSPTAIKVTVPSGATTGTIQVTTPRGTLKSNLAFKVVP